MVTEHLEKLLEAENSNLGEFQELLIRLLNWGVLCRNESQTEQQFYDRFLRMEALVIEYLYIMDIKVFHDSRFEYVRLFPPGAKLPGMEEAENNAFNGSLRQKLNQSEVAFVLILRIQYDKALREGKVDEHGFVTESIESLVIAVKNTLGRSLPEKLHERSRLFRRMAQLRLIKYSGESELENADACLKIHPMIVNFVSDEVIRSLDDASEEETTDETVENV